MKNAPLIAPFLGMVVGLGLALAAPAQEPRKGAAAAESIDSINAEFQEQLRDLQRKRIDRLAKLAASQPADQAEETYTYHFQIAIDGEMFEAAEPIAEKLLQKPRELSPRLAVLAHLVNVMAEVDAGEYEQSLKSLQQGFDLANPEQGEGALPVSSKLLLLDLYYQRLMQADQFQVAREALEIVANRARAPEVKQLAASRLARLKMIGQPAPPLVGTDLDGKPFDLAAQRGKVVLIVFWASWSIPDSQQHQWLGQVFDQHHARGFEVVGVNLDTLQEGVDPASVVTHVRRFLLDHNVTWPVLLNGQGDQDYARAYGITEVPSSVLVGRDGKIIHLDLNAASLPRVVSQALGQK